MKNHSKCQVLLELLLTTTLKYGVFAFYSFRDIDIYDVTNNNIQKDLRGVGLGTAAELY